MMSSTVVAKEMKERQIVMIRIRAVDTGTRSGLMKSSNCCSSGNSSSRSGSSSSSRSNNNVDKSSTDNSSIDVFHVDVEGSSRRSAASSSEHGHNIGKDMDTTVVTSLKSSHDSLSSSKANVPVYEWMKTICVVTTITAIGSSYKHDVTLPSLSFSDITTTIVGKW
jgi:hypothetical protein